MDLSVVIPVYQGAAFVAERLSYLRDFLAARGPTFEIVAVDDGSTDATAQVLGGLTSDAIVPVLGGPHAGKFGALRRGVARSRGRIIAFTDADVPFELDGLLEMYRLLDGGAFHLVIGDRNLAGSVYAVELSWLRRVATRVFSSLVRRMLAEGLDDTQCGMKAFRGDVARALFPLLQERGFAGDVETLYIARMHGLEIGRVPVRLAFQGPSSVRAVRHGIDMFASLRRIARRRESYRSTVITALAEGRQER